MKIMVATPVGGWSISAIYWVTMDSFKIECKKRGWDLLIKAQFGTSDLIRARNVAAHIALKWDADKLITFDEDQGTDVETLVALIESPHALSAAPVPKKQPGLPPEQAFNFLCEPDRAPVIEGDWMRVATVGSGCMCIDRRLLIKMCYENPYFVDQGEPIPEMYKRALVEDDPLFPTQFSEDYSFCLCARNKCGEPVWLYLPGKVKHQGSAVFEKELLR